MVLLASGIVDERLVGDWSLLSTVPASVGAWNLKLPKIGLVLTHCWALRNHTGLLDEQMLSGCLLPLSPDGCSV
jgi:hypothetical protein